MYYKFRNQTHNNCLTFNPLLISYEKYKIYFQVYYKVILKRYIYKKFKKNNNLNKNNNLIILTKYK